MVCMKIIFSFFDSFIYETLLHAFVCHRRTGNFVIEGTHDIDGQWIKEVQTLGNNTKIGKLDAKFEVCNVNKDVIKYTEQ